MMRLFLCLFLMGTYVCFGQPQKTKSSGDCEGPLFVTSEKRLIPYVWSPVSVDTLVVKDANFMRVLSENITPDRSSVKGKVLYASMVYEVRIDTVQDLTVLKCYYPYFRARDFGEYTRKYLAGEFRDRDNRETRNSLFGYVIVNGVPVLISGNGAGLFFEKKGSILLANPYPKNAVVYDEYEKYATEGLDMNDDSGNAVFTYLYRNGNLESFLSY